MNIHNHQSVIRLEGIVAERFQLQELGRKLLVVAIDLLLATMGTVCVNAVAIMLLDGAQSVFWALMVPWTAILGWAWWRFFFRYTRLVDSTAFLCVDGRLKKGSERSLVDFGGLNVCVKCEKSRLALISLGETIDSLRRSVREYNSLNDGTYPSVPHPIVHVVYRD